MDATVCTLHMSFVVDKVDWVQLCDVDTEMKTSDLCHMRGKKKTESGHFELQFELELQKIQSVSNTVMDDFVHSTVKSLNSL